ncbi:MAG: hypothetical protein HYY13_10755 [Nitrospirae bacterium]|nr:hypothetical protein [Nitrospirota bacterium]
MKSSPLRVVYWVMGLAWLLAGARMVWASPPHVGGYFRARGQLFRDRDLDTGRDPSTTAFVDQRLKLDAEFALTDDAKAAAQFDVLDNLVWGLNGPGLMDLSDLARTDNFNREAKIDDALTVRRVWGEFVTPLGVLVVGRQPVHWGLGLFYNDGNCLDCDFGDTQDRVLFVTRVGPVVLSPFLGKVIEGPVEQRGPSPGAQVALFEEGETRLRDLPSFDADASDMGVAVTYRPTPYEVGLLWTNRFQKAEPLSGRLTLLDVYGIGDLDFIRTEGEVVFVDGHSNNAAIPEPERTDVTKLGLTGRGYWKRPYLHFGLQYGFASGPARDEYNPSDPRTFEGTQQDEFRFDRDFSAGLLLFEEVMNDQVVRTGFRKIGGGAVRNAHFFRAFWFGDWSFVEPRASILSAFSSREINGRRNLGWEMDLESTFRIRGGFEALAQVGLLFPGGAAREFLGSAHASPVLTVQLGTYIKF